MGLVMRQYENIPFHRKNAHGNNENSIQGRRDVDGSDKPVAKKEENE